MKGTEKIIAHIRSDAEEQANAILDEAAEQCAAIKSGCEEQAKDTYAERIRAGVKECESRADSMKRMAQMESRKGVLALKQELVSASFDKAVEMIVALPREQYVSLLAKLASEAAVTGSEEIVLNARDREAIGADVVKAADALFNGGSFSLSDETGSFAGGLMLRPYQLDGGLMESLAGGLSMLTQPSPHQQFKHRIPHVGQTDGADAPKLVLRHTDLKVIFHDFSSHKKRFARANLSNSVLTLPQIPEKCKSCSENVPERLIKASLKS